MLADRVGRPSRRLAARRVNPFDQPVRVLTEARIRALRPRKTASDIRDKNLGGFGVRVLPSDRKRFFIHCQHRGERVWKIACRSVRRSRV